MRHRSRSLLATGLLLIGTIGLTGCVHIRTPYDQNLDETTLGSKTGEAHWQSILGLFAWGDAGTAAAAKDGGLSVIHHADVETLAVLFFLYVKRTTILYGD